MEIHIQIHREPKNSFGSRVTKTILKANNEVGVHTHLNTETYSKTTVIKIE